MPKPALREVTRVKLRKASSLNSFQFATVLTLAGAYFAALDVKTQDAVLTALHIRSPALALAVVFVVYVLLRLRRQAMTPDNADLSWSWRSFLDKPSAFFALLFAACCAGWDMLGVDRQQAALAALHLDTTSPAWPMLTATLAIMRAAAVQPPEVPEESTGIDPTHPAAFYAMQENEPDQNSVNH